jgi:hypothetical protein
MGWPSCGSPLRVARPGAAVMSMSALTGLAHLPLAFEPCDRERPLEDRIGTANGLEEESKADFAALVRPPP